MAPDISRLTHAFSFAAEKHNDQRRKGMDKSPYINHPAEVADLVSQATNGQDVNLIIAAILHDTKEDTDTSLDEIRAIFGDDVAERVNDVSDDKSLTKAERKQQQIDHAAHLCQRSQILKMADKIANLRTTIFDPPEDWDLARKVEYFVWAKKVVDNMRGANQFLEDKFDEIYATGMAALEMERLGCPVPRLNFKLI